jgi:hypothetical protein
MASRASTSVPALLRQQIDRWAETWLKSQFSQVLELRAQDPGPFNYPIAVFSEWRGKAFYLNVRYRAPIARASRGRCVVPRSERTASA